MRRASGHPVVIAAESIEPGSMFKEPVIRQMTPLMDHGFREDVLQKLIHDHPEILPIHEIEAGFGEPVAICREMQTRNGFIDNLLLTAEGNIILTEVKLFNNPEARRKVVAQALDYISCLFEMSYEDFEAAALGGMFAKGMRRPGKLYDLIPGETALPERDFIEAVSANLRRGRVLVLVVGEGIRTETKRLADLLQHHAGAHLTFALVELGLYRFEGHILVCPRTLMQTEIVQRGIVLIEEGRPRIMPVEKAKVAQPAHSGAGRPTSITAEQFYEQMAKIDPAIPEKLQKLLADLEPLGVYPDFRKTLQFAWDAAGDGQIVLGYLDKDGRMWMYGKSRHVPQALFDAYAKAVADDIGGQVNPGGSTGPWVNICGKAPMINDIIDKLAVNWKGTIEAFQKAVVGDTSTD